MLDISKRLLAITFFSLAVTHCQAGIGPENLVVVVNADSRDSRTIANHYVELRKIPTRNVIFLSNVPPEMVTTLDMFRDQILKPLLEEIDKRGLATQVRAIAYSANFPYAVKIEPHRARLTNPDLIKIFTPVASINGLTYFFRFVLSDREEYLSPTSNLYARMPFFRNFTQPFAGEDGEKFDEAIQALDDLTYEEASRNFAELFEKYPTQAPLGVLAARSLMGENRIEAAIEQLKSAVVAGWTSRLAIENDPDFATLKTREDFQLLLANLSDAPYETQLPVAFEAIRSWAPNGWWNRPDQGGVSYLPSCMLAVTRKSGTTVDEAIAYLKTAASADNTFPDGTVYLTKTKDIRTKTRQPAFGETIEMLQRLDHKVKLINTGLPENADDVIGVCFGTPTYNWPASGSKFLPGAIGDNLTSTSGVLSRAAQTSLCKLLQAGAAMASGTVAEPYALQFKFPLPQLHAYYAEGFTALESYYLSVSSPYQLLIVGDPICQPFARQPVETVSGRLAQVEGAKAIVLRTPVPADIGEKGVDLKKHSPLTEVEVYVEGRLVQRTVRNEQYVMKLDGLSGGSYELRTVLIGEPQTAPRKTVLTWFDAEGLFPTPKVTKVEELEGPKTSDGRATFRAKLELSAVGADSIRLMHFGTEVAKLTSDQMQRDVGVVEFDLEPLGDGPIRLRPIADFRGTEVAGREFTVEHQ